MSLLHPIGSPLDLSESVTVPYVNFPGIIKRGGVAYNIIPEETEMSYGVRALTAAELQEVRPRIEACFDAAAKATGCSCDVAYVTPTVKNLVTNEVMVQVYKKHGENLGES